MHLLYRYPLLEANEANDVTRTFTCRHWQLRPAVRYYLPALQLSENKRFRARVMITHVTLTCVEHFLLPNMSWPRFVCHCPIFLSMEAFTSGWWSSLFYGRRSIPEHTKEVNTCSACTAGRLVQIRSYLLGWVATQTGHESGLRKWPITCSNNNKTTWCSS